MTIVAAPKFAQNSDVTAKKIRAMNTSRRKLVIFENAFCTTVCIVFYYSALQTASSRLSKTCVCVDADGPRDAASRKIDHIALHIDLELSRV